MSISHDDAAKALEAVRSAQHRTRLVRGYERSAPHFWLWGVIWMLGYALTDLRPEYANWVWLALDVSGWIGSMLIARRQRTAAGSAATAAGWKIGAAVLLMAGFLVATYYVLAPTASKQYAAMPALMMALLYSLVGLLAGARWLTLGLALFALTLGGYALLPSHFLMWMALAGGGALLLTGAWMRRA